MTLNTRHHSVSRGAALKPHNMSRMTCTDAERELIERQAISIFEDCTNANMSFRDALSAILISGMDWAIQAQREQEAG